MGPMVGASLAWDLCWLLVYRFDWLDNYGAGASLLWKQLKMGHRIVYFVVCVAAVLKLLVVGCVAWADLGLGSSLY